MKKLILLLSVILILIFAACRDNVVPSAPGGLIPVEEEKCSAAGINVYFVDSCSYTTSILFLHAFSEVKILDTFLGNTFYIYADSGDFNHWYNRFHDDLTVNHITNVSTGSDSLIMKFDLSGERPLDYETEKFSGTAHLKILKLEKNDNHAFVEVPDSTEDKWIKKFKEFVFIKDAVVVVVCE